MAVCVVGGGVCVCGGGGGSAVAVVVGRTACGVDGCREDFFRGMFLNVTFNWQIP